MDEPMDEKIENAINVAKGMVASRTQPDDVQKVAQSILNLSHLKVTNDSAPTSELDEELTFVLGRIRTHLDATSLVQLTQAALHIGNARVILTSKVKQKKQGAGA